MPAKRKPTGPRSLAERRKVMLDGVLDNQAIDEDVKGRFTGGPPQQERSGGTSDLSARAGTTSTDAPSNPSSSNSSSLSAKRPTPGSKSTSRSMSESSVSSPVATLPKTRTLCALQRPAMSMTSSRRSARTLPSRDVGVNRAVRPDEVDRRRRETSGWLRPTAFAICLCERPWSAADLTAETNRRDASARSRSAAAPASATRSSSSPLMVSSVEVDSKYYQRVGQTIPSMSQWQPGRPNLFLPCPQGGVQLHVVPRNCRLLVA